MPSYLHPGVYVEEIPSGSKPIEGVGTSTAAFVGYTAKGAISEPKLIFTWDDYDREFGGIQNLQKDKKGDSMGLSVFAFFQNGGRQAYIARITDEADYVNVFTKFSRIRDINIMCLPGQYWSTNGSGNSIIQMAIDHARKIKSRMVIVDLPPTYELKTKKMVTDMRLPGETYCAVYYPWIETANKFYHAERYPDLPKNVLVPPSGYVAGMWAKIDGKRGVWKAPAGMETALLGVSKLEYKVKDGEQDLLNPLGVNCLRTMTGAGEVIWGARTCATRTDPEWRYVAVRRTAIMIEQSIYEGIQWAVFEPNDHRLWSALRANINNFMNGLFRVGAFQGEKASDAYFVRCGLGDTMTQSEIDAGQVIVIVGFAPLKPAEFVIVRIQQKVNSQ